MSVWVSSEEDACPGSEQIGENEEGCREYGFDSKIHSDDPPDLISAAVTAFFTVYEIQ